MLGGGHGVAAGGVHDDDAARGGSVDVHVVHADPGAADCFEIFGCGDDIGSDFGLTAHHEGREFGNDLKQLVVRQAGLESYIQLTTLGQGVDAGLRDGIGDKDFGLGHRRSRVSGVRSKRHAHNGSVS